jgi:Ca2+/H+ antiporter
LTTQQPSPKLEPLEALSVVRRRGDVEKLSVGVAIVLVLTYVAGLFCSLRTHKDLFNPTTRRTITSASRGRSAV